MRIVAAHIMTSVVHHAMQLVDCHACSPHVSTWPGGVMVRGVGLATQGRRFEFLPLRSIRLTTLGKLSAHKCLYYQAVSFRTSQGAVIPCGWEGNRRSGFALVMHH